MYTLFRLVIFFPFFIWNILWADVFVVHCRDRQPDLYLINGGCGGPVAELAEMLVSDAGHSILWQPAPWSRTMLDAQTGRVDLVVRHSMNPAREGFLLPMAYGGQWRSVYYFSKMSIASIEDLNYLTVGQLAGSFYSTGYEMNRNVRKFEVETTEQLIKMLKADRLDVVITSTAHEVSQFSEEVPEFEQAYVERYFNGRYFSVPKQSDKSKYAEMLKEKLKQYSEDGTIQAIFKRYGREWSEEE